MQLLLIAVTVAFFMVADATTNPCLNKVCPNGQVCREVETCSTATSCQYSAVCISKQQSSSLSGGCHVGEPLLERVKGALQLRTCYTDKNCQPDFWCSTLLHGVSSRCCRASTPVTKHGNCPPPTPEVLIFCVDECRSDADCSFDEKCCQPSETCQRKRCFHPIPN